jgi:hypothetical protein
VVFLLSDEEFVDVHEGGELSWMQRISNLVRLYGRRIEAHGDSARIVIGDSSIDLGTIEGRACLQAHLELPISRSSGVDLEDLLKRVIETYRAIYTVQGAFKYILDDSLGDFKVVHIVKCYEKPQDLEKDLEEILKSWESYG